MTEDQKYQGALYREKPSKNQNRKSISSTPHNSESKALVPRRAYVEDIPDEADAPPAAPSPPPNNPIERPGSVNVFDFLVNEQSPNVSQVSLGGSKEPMTMKKGAASLFSESNKQVARRDYSEDEHDDDYQENGYSYGAEPVKPTIHPTESLTSLDFKTPTAKNLSKNLKEKGRPSHHRSDSGLSDRKRKRGHVDPLDLSATGGDSQESVRYELEGDTLMPDAENNTTPIGLAHSGLTGGLNRLLSDSAFPLRQTTRTKRRGQTDEPIQQVLSSDHVTLKK